MAFEVVATDSPAEVLEEARDLLQSDVRHNLILSLLQARVEHPMLGRYWIVRSDGKPVGVGFQSPVEYFATVTPMPLEAVVALVDTIADSGVVLPGVTGEAATAARFAGHWTERTRSAAHPHQGQRIYEVAQVLPARSVGGHVRSASEADRDLMVLWFEGFGADTGGTGPSGAAEAVDRRLGGGQLWLWDDAGPKAMAGLSPPVGGVVRVGPVYTPAELRGRGYASALVGSLSNRVRVAGDRCILYTDLANPTSNAVYRALGYRAVAEGLIYRFGEPLG